jgi:hypothetical protein
MLTTAEKEELFSIVNDTLDRCEILWKKTLGDEKLIKKAQFVDTNIPGHPYLAEDRYKSDLFLAFMLDMRDSKKHLQQRIDPEKADVSQMERIFYEVSALLPAMSKLIKDKKGAVTEYLGDGLLALFQLHKKEENVDRLKSGPILSDSMKVAKKCLSALDQIVNPVLYERYRLPALQIGIGMAYSDAIITHFGLAPDTQVKVIGECIYYASQLSKGINEIHVHKNLKLIWPTSKQGQIKFSQKKFKDFWGYKANYS